MACRIASVEAQTRLICLTLRREVFVEILGPLEQLMTREKSPQVITQRLLKLQTKGTPTHMPAEVLATPHHNPFLPPVNPRLPSCKPLLPTDSLCFMYFHCWCVTAVHSVMCSKECQNSVSCWGTNIAACRLHQEPVKPVSTSPASRQDPAVEKLPVKKEDTDLIHAGTISEVVC